MAAAAAADEGFEIGVHSLEEGPNAFGKGAGVGGVLGYVFGEEAVERTTDLELDRETISLGLALQIAKKARLPMPAGGLMISIKAEEGKDENAPSIKRYMIEKQNVNIFSLPKPRSSKTSIAELFLDEMLLAHSNEEQWFFVIPPRDLKLTLGPEPKLEVTDASFMLPVYGSDALVINSTTPLALGPPIAEPSKPSEEDATPAEHRLYDLRMRRSQWPNATNELWRYREQCALLNAHELFNSNNVRWFRYTLEKTTKLKNGGKTRLTYTLERDPVPRRYDFINRTWERLEEEKGSLVLALPELAGEAEATAQGVLNYYRKQRAARHEALEVGARASLANLDAKIRTLERVIAAAAERRAAGEPQPPPVAAGGPEEVEEEYEEL